MEARRGDEGEGYRSKGKNKTLSLEGTINLRKFEGKPDKSWLRNERKVSKLDNSVKFNGTSDFEEQISAVEKVEESYRSK